MHQTQNLPAAVERAGLALFGEQWQQPLARLLNINSRTMQRIAAAAKAGEPYPVAPGAVADLIRALDARVPEIAESRAQLEAALEGLKSKP